MRKGFSLVELSIVLVILGLLTGGILAGQSLMKSAQLKSITSDFEKYNNATLIFRQKYDALPGDFANAVNTWVGTPAAVGVACVTTASTTAATCNGNDDGLIAVSTNSNELFRYWQHLANAGLIQGQYSGVKYAALDYSARGGYNTPSGQLSNSAWMVITQASAYSGHAFWFDGTYNTRMSFGSNQANSEPSSILTPPEMWNIDKKTDDGKPGRGSIITGRWDDCTDAATSADLDADYDLDVNTSSCNPVFPNLFVKL